MITPIGTNSGQSHPRGLQFSRGQQAGDRLLPDASAAWQACLPEEALVARYGGEEFGVPLPGVDLDATIDVRDQFRSVVPEQQTLSAGLAAWDGTEEPAALVARADAAMYPAKREERDRVSIARPPGDSAAASASAAPARGRAGDSGWPGTRLTVLAPVGVISRLDPVDQGVAGYVAAISETHRPLFDRLHAIVFAERPDAEVTLSYGMPTYKAGRQRLYVAVWKHGLSIYGWDRGRAQAFVDSHPELITSKGTIKVGLADAARVSDDEWRALIHAALDD